MPDGRRRGGARRGHGGGRRRRRVRAAVDAGRQRARGGRGSAGRRDGARGRARCCVRPTSACWPRSGVPMLRVARRPRVAILATGDELVDVGEPLGPGQIVNCNAYTLAAAVEEAGGEPIHLGIVRDRPELIRAAFADAISAPTWSLSTGGVSVGSFDYVRTHSRRARLRGALLEGRAEARQAADLRTVAGARRCSACPAIRCRRWSASTCMRCRRCAR